MPAVKFNNDSRFDFDLGRANVDERRLADIFLTAKIEKVELKTDYKWQQTGNLCVEYRYNGKPSGIAATKADFWVHELPKNGNTVGYFMFPVEQFKELCRKEYRKGNIRNGVGDDGKSDVILIKSSDLLK